MEEFIDHTFANRTGNIARSGFTSGVATGTPS
jgi:hypothetical protein